METNNGQEHRLLSEEKSRQYAESKQLKDKACREQRKKEKMEGNLQNRRLSFIVNILNAYRISRTDLARRLNNTTQNLYWIFSVRDDCSLSKAREILATLGLSLKVKINKKKARPKIQKTEYTTKDQVTSKIISKLPELASAYRTVKIPKYITDYPDGKELSFLARYLESTGYSIPEIEEKLNISRGAIRQYFVSGRDDIDISKIYDIAKVTNGEIIWNIDRLQKEE